jgi:hypothetical protein
LAPVLRRLRRSLSGARSEQRGVIHFADNPDDLLCGRVAIKTLCSRQHMDVTNWNVENVTCERCLEVMEDRAVGIEKVTRVHDEVIVERVVSYPAQSTPKPWLPKPFPVAQEYGPPSFNATMTREMAEAFKKMNLQAEAFEKMKQEIDEEVFARVKKKS